MMASVVKKLQEGVDYWLSQPATPDRTFTTGSTAYEVASANEDRIRDRVFFITGCTHGMGKEAARQIARKGGIVVLASRDPSLVAGLAYDLQSDCSPEARVHDIHLDLADLNSVKQAVRDFRSLGLPGLHVLINNAGVAFTEYKRTTDGLELQFQTNYLGPFLLTLLLLPDLIKVATPDNMSRIVNVASVLHRAAYLPEGIRLDDLAQKKWYNPVAAYGQSKLAMILFTVELSKRLAAMPMGGLVTCNAMHPGAVNSPITRHFMLKPLSSFSYLLYTSLLGKSVEQVWCAVAPELDGVTGKYISSDGTMAPYWHPGLSRDPSLGAKLWAKSAALTGIDLPPATATTASPPHNRHHHHHHHHATSSSSGGGLVGKATTVTTVGGEEEDNRSVW